MTAEIWEERKMTLKATWLWNGFNKQQNLFWGFSETWYTDDSPAALQPKMDALAAIRTQLRGTTCVYYGARMADTAPNSRAFTIRSDGTIKASTRNGGVNVAPDAALCLCFGTVAGTSKRFWLHALPDGFIDEGNFDPGSNVPTKAALWINTLAAQGFKFRFIDPTAPTGQVLSIDSFGNVVLIQPIAGVAPNSLVQLLKVRGVDGRGKRGKFYVDTVTDASHFKLAHWPGDVVAQSGKIRIVRFNFTSIAPVPAAGPLADPTIRAGVRKVGRPFGQLRGRAVARR